jgi:exopolysaccharide biosynthesis polyprenyl glycosylphosphotransferase
MNMDVEAAARSLTPPVRTGHPRQPTRLSPVARVRELLFVGESAAPAVVRRREARYRRLLAVADVVSIVAALGLATLIPGAPSPKPQLLLVIPLIVLLAKLLALYDRDELLLRKTTLDETPQLFHLATLATVLSWLLDAIGSAPSFGPLSGLVLWTSCFALLLGCRTVSRDVASRTTPPERLLFIGDEELSRQFRSKLELGGGIKAGVAARMELDEAASWVTGGLGKTTLDDVRRVVDAFDVHRVILAPRTTSGSEILDLVRILKAAGTRVSVLPALFEVIGSSVEFDDVHGLTVLGVRSFKLSRSSSFIKRTFDLVGATVGLLAVSPLMLIAAIAIKLDSRGPVFFKQERVGRKGKRFYIYKFRTMVMNADELKPELRTRNEGAEGFFKIVDDPRITRVGRLLRRTSLDELPQLLNVIAGKMSLVGPRPLVVEEDNRVEGWHRRRLELTPGITGHWQVLGSSRIPLDEMVAIDYLYVANWSLWNDVKLMLRTVPHVLGRRGI